MKHIKLTFIIFICLSKTILADQLPKRHSECVEEMAKEGYNLIDAIFEQAQISTVAQEDIMDHEWFKQREEIGKLRNLLSDATIMHCFDQNIADPIPGLLETYLQDKIREEVPKIFAIHEISIKRVKDFYEFSHTMCKLSGGSHCGRMMRTIESDNFDKMLKLKLQKIARKQLRKENAQQWREALLFGAHR